MRCFVFQNTKDITFCFARNTVTGKLKKYQSLFVLFNRIFTKKPQR